MVVVTAFVQKSNCIGHRQETVRKSSRNINLVLLFCAEEDASPLTEVGGTLSYIHRDVERLAFHNAAQFRLRMVQLIVEPSQGAFPGTRMVVLYESLFDSELAEFCEMECLHEETSRIAKDFRT